MAHCRGCPNLPHTFPIATLLCILRGEEQVAFLKCRPGLACHGKNGFTLLMGSRPIYFTCPQPCRVWPHLCLWLHLPLCFPTCIPLWAHSCSFSCCFSSVPSHHSLFVSSARDDPLSSFLVLKYWPKYRLFEKFLTIPFPLSPPIRSLSSVCWGHSQNFILIYAKCHVNLTNIWRIHISSMGLKLHKARGYVFICLQLHAQKTLIESSQW